MNDKMVKVLTIVFVLSFSKIGIGAFQSIYSIGVIINFIPNPFIVADKIAEINCQIGTFSARI